MSETDQSFVQQDDDEQSKNKDNVIAIPVTDTGTASMTVTTACSRTKLSFVETSPGITSTTERRFLPPTENSFFWNSTKYAVHELLLLKEYINVYKKYGSHIWLCLSHEPRREVFLLQKTFFFSKYSDVSACVGRCAKFNDDRLSFPLYTKRERKKIKFALTPSNTKKFIQAVTDTDELKGVFNSEGVSKKELITDSSFYKWQPMTNLERVVLSQTALLPAYIADLLPHYQPKPLSDSVVKHILIQLGTCVKSLHVEGLFHGCICPGLVYMSPDLRIMTMEMGRLQAQWSDSIRWRSPELTELCNNFSPDDRSTLQSSAEGLRKRQASDVWAFGCMAMFLSTALIPFPEESDPLSILTQLQVLICTQERKALSTQAEIYASDNCTYCSLETLLNLDKISNESLRDVVARCTTLNYKKRPTLESILSMPFFTSAEIGNISSKTTYGSILRSINVDLRTQNVSTLEPTSEAAQAIAACFNAPVLGEVAASILTKSAIVVRNIQAYMATRERGPQHQDWDRLSTTTDSMVSTEPDAPEVKHSLAPHMSSSLPQCCIAFKETIYGGENDDAMREAFVLTLHHIAAEYRGPSKQIFFDVDTLVDALKSQTRAGRLREREREENLRYNEDSAFRDEELIRPSDNRVAAEYRNNNSIEICSSDNEENVIESDMLDLDGNCFREVAVQRAPVAFTAEEIVPKSTVAKRLLVGKTRFIILGVSIGMFVVVVIVVVLLAVLLTRK